jgi:signal transduction histidine kinase/ActR/RegA family two-component response regulator
MKKPSDPPEGAEDLREKIIGFGERSGRKSYYPELRERLSALEFLSRASVRLASSLDVGGTLQNLAELAVPSLGDFCAIDARTSDGRSEHLLVACSDPEQKALAERLLAGRALAGTTGEDATPGPQLLTPAADGADPALLELMRRLALVGLMVIPLASAGRALGTLLIASGRSARSYGPFDLELATEFGHRAALALENARLLLRAQEASRLKDEFLAIVSHELRTPLTAILGWTEMLRTRRFDPVTLDRGLAVVERNARALAQIIDDLLGVSRIVAGRFEIQPAPTELVPVVESAVEALRPDADSNHVAVRFEPDPGVPPVMGDAKRLRQVVWNLVSNAVKYTPGGGEVTVRLARVGGSAELTVSDTGCGISPAFLPHVFEPFRQADSSATRRFGGLGLGLAIVRHLVELHGGSIRAASEGEGRGACFTVTLPLAAEQCAEAPDSEPQLPYLPGVRVLLVEDDPDTLELLVQVLERQGARVVAARSAGAALAEIDRAGADVLVSDIAMPGQDGVSLLQAIRARGCQIPALALSALTREEDRARALAAGFERYLVKPVDPREILRAIAHEHAHAHGPPTRGAAGA